MNFGKWSAEIVRDPRSGFHAPWKLVVFRLGASCMQYLATDGTVRDINETEEIPKECFWPIPEETWQGILDAIWERGLRPKDRRYENEAELLKAHLRDMRHIAFGSFGKKPPESPL